MVWLCQLPVAAERYRQPIVAACNVDGATIAWLVKRLGAHLAIEFALLATTVLYTPSLQTAAAMRGIFLAAT
jgi:hypothetical protein